MQNLSLHFPQGRTADRALGTGVHRIVREASGNIGVGDAVPGALLVQVCLDRRGLWLQVPSGMRGIHVNGRPVRRMAMLRPGDAIYADGVEVLVRGQASTTTPYAAPRSGESDPRIVLRGIGGRHHGKAFPIESGCVVGAAREADIRVEAPHIGQQHARLNLHGGGVVLRHHDGAVISVVNGIPVHEAMLGAGDQIAFDPQSRFVIEIPWAQMDADKSLAADDADLEPAPQVNKPSGASMKRWPWLLIAAAGLAGLLSLLLLFGAG
ncbi:FHA domain-containing protein [Pseudoxanthomonas sp. GM95]|uniref:FHA domain-containing protein n=1 Tax=Pseudoxanthomonas sp. GM95 TaxID=1881043 RepID=UPI000B89065A|nr:FHA domain-containing protein [Pseudoxanthomonas sp. GM95]